MTCKVQKIKTDYYEPEEDELANFEVDQTILIKEDFLKYVSIYRKHQTKVEFLESPFLDDWYPYVNSYYPYTEDVDAFARVSHLLGSRPSFASLSSEESQCPSDGVEYGIPYSEHAAQLRYLESSPFSFIILGKPDIGQQELGKKLANYWQCVYIDPQILIEQEILSGSRAGQCIEFNLKSGRAIGIDVILRLVSKRIKSESAKHRGFVVSGMPLIPNGLYQEDPISSESAVFTVKEIFEDMFDTTIETAVVPPIKPRTSMSSKYKSEEGEYVGEEETHEEKVPVEEEVEEEEVELPRKQGPVKPTPLEIPVDTGPDYDVCQAPQIGTNFEDQLNFIFDLIQHPFMIIYVMCSTADVIEKRKSYRFDVHSRQTINLQTQLYNYLLYNYVSEQKDLNEEIPEDIFESDYVSVDITHINYLVRLPRHFPANVATQLDSYHYTGLNFIERRILMHDPQYYLKVDGRTSVQRMLHIIKARLKILPIQQVILPSRLNVEHQEMGEDGPQESGGEVPNLEGWFRTFSRKEIPNSRFKWTLSDWGMRCPVALKEGTLKNGDPQYTVHFMNKLFILANENNFFKFYRNPRPYLLPPYPKPTCKIFVFGPKCSGKTAISRCLSYLLDGSVLSMADMLATYLYNQQEELKEKIRQAAIAEAMAMLNEQRAEEAKQLEGQRVEKIKEWVVSTKKLIEELMAVLVEMSKDQTVTSFEISSFPMAMKKVSMMETETPIAIEFIRLKDQIQTLRIPFSYKLDDWQALLSDKRKLLIYMPVNLRSKVVPKPATVFDDFVVDYARKAVENADLHDASISNKSLANIMINNMKAIEEERIQQGNTKGGWILDGMLCDLVILDELFPDYIADEVIVLLDDKDPNFLLNRYQMEGETDIEDYREFFMSIGKLDAAWRSPFKLPKKSNTPKLIHELLLDIIDDPNAFNYGDDGPVDKLEAYRQDILNFNQKWDEIKGYFSDRNIVPIEVKITDKTVTDLMKDVIEQIEDRYRLKASLFTELDRAEEVKNFGSQMLQKDVSEGDHNIKDDAFEKNRQYGDTYHYCPVTFHDKWVLWKGKEDYAVKFENKLYLLSSEDDMNNFLRIPRHYLPGEPPKAFPPPRICIVGVPGTCRTAVAKAIANNYGLTYVSFESMIKKSLGITTTQSLNSLRRNEGTHPSLFAYLTMDLPLEENLVRDNMSKFWFGEPIRGFVIDDFPKRPSDIKLMTTHKLIPDIVINLTSIAGNLKSRLVQKQLDRWEAQMKEKRVLIEKQSKVVRVEWEQKRKKRFDELMEDKKERRYALKKQNKEEPSEEQPSAHPLEDLKEEETDRSDMRTVSQVSFDSVAEQEDIKEINEILDGELPEPIAEDTLETVEEARDRFENYATDTISTETGFLKNIRNLCSSEEIQFIDIPVNYDYFDLTIRNAYVVIDKYKFRSKSHFERCYDLSMEDAEKLLACGYFFLSKFGKTCPVQYYEDNNPFQMYIPMEKNDNIFPVIHRSYIYYIVGRESQAKFKVDPLMYISVESFHNPLLTLRVAVTGPPKCGKTMLAKRIASECCFKLITRGQAARYVLTYLPLSDLAKCMESVLRKGWELTDEMVVKCVEAATFDAKAVTQGVVFDGFPNTIAEVRHLSYTALVPNIAIDLQATPSEIFECLSSDSGRRGLPRFSQRFVEHLLSEWESTSETFRDWFDREYQVLVSIPISSSKWLVWTQTWKYITAVFFEIKHYFVHVADDWPVRLANMQITPLEFLERQGAFKTYCPSCLHFSNVLTNGGDPPDRTGLVQYKQFFYWVCPNHIDYFLINPDKFMVPYNNHSLPPVLPEVSRLTSMPDNVFEDGLCVVCYKKKKAFIKGKIQFAVQYNNSTYLFDTRECFREFNRNPHQYMCEINFKPPNNYPPLNYKDLPIVGMLEQYVANYVTKALSFVARHRPVIPGLDVSTSALIGVGLHLKLINPNAEEKYRTLYKEADDLYQTRRTKLVNYLDRMKSVINPYLHYEEPLPEFELPVSIKSESTESVCTTVTRLVDEIIDNIDYD